MRQGMMRRTGGLGRVMTVLLVLILCTGMGMTAFATEAENTAVLTPEQAEQQKQQEIYAMPIQTNELEGWPQGPGTFGEAGIVMEVGTGAILYAKNIDEHEFPASITKVLTALIALENGNLTDTVTFSNNCVSFLKAGDSSVGLKEGNVISLEQALYAMLLASANEAAYAVGENVGINAGHDYNWFIEQMNTRCKELGGENSNFVNTNGLHDPNHYTCARDMALIGRELFQHPEFFNIVQTLEYVIPASGTCQEHIFQQKDKMLRPENANYYPYAVGGKTGFTSDALSTLITMADNGQTQLVCVVLRTHGKNIYPDTRNLLEYAFSNFTKVSAAEQERSEDVAEILTDQDGGYVMLPAGVEFSNLEMTLTPDEAETGEATLTYTYQGAVVGTARAALSETYVKAHMKKSDAVKEDGDSAKKTGEGKQKISDKKKIVIGVLMALWFVLVVLFVRLLVRRSRKKRRR